MDDIEQKLEELLVQLGFQETLIDSLNQTVIRQQQELELIQAQLRFLYQQVNLNQETQKSTHSLFDELPPHY
ncbi:SlyX family protein [Neisseria sp. Ec49-e6-T10]|uniref:SlyX family protein n=1 Tax=Neisseria sp. Ec49-e6-T10 TaxID=3140744 RepID=UPI003EB93403